MPIQKQIEKYWNNRANTYSEAIKKEMTSFKKEVWKQLIKTNIEKKDNIKALDLGSGPGFFTILMSELEYNVTAVDCTIKMLKEAKKNLKIAGYSANFIKSDVQKLPFLEKSFDLIICRNLVWNLKNPKKAYKEWYRVLKENGTLIIFDANWYLRLSDFDLQKKYEKEKKESEKLGYKDKVTESQEKKCFQIAKNLPLSYKKRPDWDKSILSKISFKNIVIEKDISKLIWTKEEQIRYQSTPMFSIIAKK